MLKIAIQYVVMLGFALIVASVYSFVAGAAFLPALTIGLGLSLFGVLISKVARKFFGIGTLILLGMTFVFVFVLAFHP